MTGALPFRLDPGRPAQLGLVVLQEDETLEDDFRRLLPGDVTLLVSRVPSGRDVTPESLAAMETHLGASAGLMPRGAQLCALAYGCTSGAAQIGPERIAARLAESGLLCPVTEPVSALVAACRALRLRRLGLLSPYVAPVSERLRAVLHERGLTTPAFGSFGVSEEAIVCRIDRDSVLRAAAEVAGQAEVDGLFLSCTNLRTMEAIPLLEQQLGLPVLSSNLVLGWHLLQLAGLPLPPGRPGRLFAQAAGQ
ncbi:maleate cis-trans isomerase family protein [Marinibacterium profundimaris]|uniref:Asp/Glu racemase n=1 Tax=Marinibacterium profundimaris TaxID=1679460 RepID=A0A225NVN6_9RHOB|nr:Asp/Glu racemase [Marinibacterium profundimaris]OWU75836.1 Asp/Glu racemase [Marinibacterium profundimaris]